jgi:hypothetical protein
LILITVVILVGCMAHKEVPPAEPSQSAIPELTPPSELALLMRQMAIHADSVKATVSRGAELPAFPKAFKDLMKAEPTVGMHIDPITFPTFAKDYLNKLDRLYDADGADRQRAYNALVQGCANCHTTHCPGPLMRIKKMYIASDE